MSDLLLFCCIAIVLLQVVVTLLRFLLHSLKKLHLTVISNCIKGALLLLLLAVRYVPQVSDGLEKAVLPGIVELGLKNCAKLIMLLVLTCPLRMLVEHFLLKMPYKLTDWILIGAMILLTAVMFRTMLF